MVFFNHMEYLVYSNCRSFIQCRALLCAMSCRVFSRLSFFFSLFRLPLIFSLQQKCCQNIIPIIEEDYQQDRQLIDTAYSRNHITTGNCIYCIITTSTFTEHYKVATEFLPTQQCRLKTHWNQFPRFWNNH